MIHRTHAMLGACALILLLGSTAADAAAISFEAAIEYSGATAPVGTAPWLVATFDDGDTPGSVDLILSTPNLSGNEFVSEWNLNLDPVLDATNLIFSAPSKTGSFADPTVSKSTDTFMAGGDGRYDIEFRFATSNQGGGTLRFGAGESAMYTITGIASLTASSFDFLSAPMGGNGPFLTAAHVQGIDPNDNQSGWVTVPEPSALAILGLSIMPLAYRSWRRLKR